MFKFISFNTFYESLLTDIWIKLIVFQRFSKINLFRHKEMFKFISFNTFYKSLFADIRQKMIQVCKNVYQFYMISESFLI